MTCINCIHYGVCKNKNKKNQIGIEKKCTDFKNKSKCIMDLPCGVGDYIYLYRADYKAILAFRVECLTVGSNDKNENWYTYEARFGAEDETIEEIEFNPADVGKTVFLSPKELYNE